MEGVHGHDRERPNKGARGKPFGDSVRSDARKKY